MTGKVRGPTVGTLCSQAGNFLGSSSCKKNVVLISQKKNSSRQESLHPSRRLIGTPLNKGFFEISSLP